jgi:hypothetical protein
MKELQLNCGDGVRAERTQGVVTGSSKRPLVTLFSLLQEIKDAQATSDRFESTSIEWLQHRSHAILGSCVLGHFIYRFALLFFRSDAVDMGFDHSTWQMILLFFPHLLLQLSSFGFAIPRHRHPDGNRIWPQYRPEALVFCMRCLALMALAWYRKLHGCADNKGDLKASCSLLSAAAIIFATMMSADAVSIYYRRIGEESRTIRGLSGPVGVLYLMSSAQFHATVHCLLTKDRLCVQLAALTVVQASAFGMTMRRKTLISQNQGLVLYGMVLVLGMMVIIRDLNDRGLLYMAIAIGNIAALVRFESRMNKFLLWGFVTMALHFVLQGEEAHGIALLNLKSEGWPFLAVGSTIMLLAGAANRQFQIIPTTKEKSS